MASNNLTNVKRVMKDIQRFNSNPPPLAENLWADESNLKNIFFVALGPPDSAYQNGQYVFKLCLPTDYPHKAPTLQFLTPNGRFQTNINICVSGITHYHSETWSSTYTFSSIFVAIMSFMCEKNSAGIGSMSCSDQRKLQYTQDSRHYNLKHLSQYLQKSTD